ncbi:unnamed protein product [Phytophthora fragariaefolia]|uniref:Unnamed protein product n=1 Tax=Phytophthora fragariaefolia TaxID=1490495 RepID=A0A9W6YQ16_9STRA|nr:unnamed protein product [Phytophthora fragariaefolia]
MSDQPSLICVERGHEFDLLGRRRRRQGTDGVRPKDARHLTDRLELRVGQVTELPSIHLGLPSKPLDDSGSPIRVGVGLTKSDTKYTAPCAEETVLRSIQTPSERQLTKPWPEDS